MTFSKELLFIHHGLFEASEIHFPSGCIRCCLPNELIYLFPPYWVQPAAWAELSNLMLGLFLNLLSSVPFQFYIFNIFVLLLNTFCVFSLKGNMVKASEQKTEKLLVPQDSFKILRSWERHLNLECSWRLIMVMWPYEIHKSQHSLLHCDL